jgi:hypothetical protein
MASFTAYSPALNYQARIVFEGFMGLLERILTQLSLFFKRKNQPST